MEAAKLLETPPSRLSVWTIHSPPIPWPQLTGLELGTQPKFNKLDATVGIFKFWTRENKEQFLFRVGTGKSKVGQLLGDRILLGEDSENNVLGAHLGGEPA